MAEDESPNGQDESEETNQRVFPLPLSPFEKFLLWDETVTCPMNSFIELHFDDHLDLDCLRKSLHAAVHRNPMLACRTRTIDGEMYWEYDADYVPELRLEADDAPLYAGRPRPIDLFNECGSRYWYRETESGSRLLIQLHHACTDGVGLRRVLIDTLTGYAQRTSAESATGREMKSGSGASRTARWDKLQVELLRDRFDFSKSFSGPPARSLTTWQRIKNAHYFHFQPPTTLQQRSSNSAVTASLQQEEQLGEPLRHFMLDEVTTKAATERAKLLGVGVNEVALGLLFLACKDWNVALGDRRPASRLRLLMPYDLRSRIDLRMPAANRLSFSFLGRTHAQIGSLDDQSSVDCLIRGLQAEIKSIKETRLQMDFIEAIRGASTNPRFFRWLLSKSNRMATSVLTYTGDISRGMKKYFPEQDGCRLIGNARLRNILVAPPVRRNTNISLGLCVNWGKLCFSAAWNRDAFTATDCGDFLEIYRRCWTEWSRVTK
ncbi:MAG: hypothetical protein ACE361_14925 [Aureliella sp.]